MYNCQYTSNGTISVKKIRIIVKQVLLQIVVGFKYSDTFLPLVSEDLENKPVLAKLSINGYLSNSFHISNISG